MTLESFEIIRILLLTTAAFVMAVVWTPALTHVLFKYKMGKSLIQQARGRGSLTYRVRPRAYRFRITYPRLSTEGKAKIIKLFLLFR